MSRDQTPSEAEGDKPAPVGLPFTLVMQLEDPRQLPELLTWLSAKTNRARLDAALKALDYVHYSRFVPLFDVGKLLIVTDFDGRQKDYVLDFAAVLSTEFTKILSYMKDRPRLPVSDYPDEFYDYVERNSRFPGQTGPASQFRAYDKSVLDITGGARRKNVPALLDRRAATTLDVSGLSASVQANVLQGYFSRSPLRQAYSRHIGIAFAEDSAREARAFVGALLEKGAALGVTFAERWERHEKPPYCLNIGFTYAGLGLLGVPPLALRAFPRAFREGPAAREVREEIDPRGAPHTWELGAPVKSPADGASDTVHAFVSIHYEIDNAAGEQARQEREEALWRALKALLAAHPKVREVYRKDAATFDPHNAATIHFGYVDGIAQPRIDGLHGGIADGGQTSSLAGDFVLGARLRNSRGGNFIGSLPPPLADYGTYAAVRVIRQFTDRFDALLRNAEELGLGKKEVVAAKLMGRGLDGRPLSRAAEAAAAAARKSEVAGAEAAALNDFTFVYDKGNPDQAGWDDSSGAQCPLGAHIRRMNPRNAAVAGLTALHRVIRRGLPYGPPAAKKEDLENLPERGLFGMFLCGDLESQYEFLLRAWGNGDVAVANIRGTVDPFIGTRKGKLRFKLLQPAGNPPPALDMKPLEDSLPLTEAVGSLYLFMPGKPGLRWIADAGWEQSSRATYVPPVPVADLVSKAAAGARPTNAAAANPARASVTAAGEESDLKVFDPAFRLDPYRAYAAARAANPPGIVWVPMHNAWWVLSHALVKDFAGDQALFSKPHRALLSTRRDDREGLLPVRPRNALDAGDSFGDGLFFMPQERHQQVFPHLGEALADATARIEDFTRTQALKRLGEPRRRGRLEVVSEYAAPLTTAVFMDMMGIPENHRAGVDGWIRSTLNGHHVGAEPRVRLEGGSARMALRGYFHALSLGGIEPTTAAGDVPLMAAIRHLAGNGREGTGTCPVHATSGSSAPPVLTLTESLETALHFALGGYLSTEFLLTTGVFNLLSNPQQLARLMADLDGRLDGAIQEMLRFDAPFQMADRILTRDHEVQGVAMKKGQTITLVYGSANRDPAVVTRPDRFDILRDPVEHFGLGVPRERYCIGSTMAMTVARVALRTLLENFPFADPPQMQAGEWLPDPYYRSLKSLLVLGR